MFSRSPLALICFTSGNYKFSCSKIKKGLGLIATGNVPVFSVCTSKAVQSYNKDFQPFECLTTAEQVNSGLLSFVSDQSRSSLLWIEFCWRRLIESFVMTIFYCGWVYFKTFNTKKIVPISIRKKISTLKALSQIPWRSSRCRTRINTDRHFFRE